MTATTVVDGTCSRMSLTRVTPCCAKPASAMSRFGAGAVESVWPPFAFTCPMTVSDDAWARPRLSSTVVLSPAATWMVRPVRAE